MKLGKHSLASMLAGAGTAMVGLTGLAIVVLTSSSGAMPTAEWTQIALMVGSSSCATIFVLSLLHSDLQKYYIMLSERELVARTEARIDGLTELSNRKALYEDLAAVSGPDGPITRSCLVIIDLDEFKNVNDTMGHATGDALLKEMASRLQDALPANGAAYRLGGDEFALILQGFTIKDAQKACEKIRAELIEEYYFEGLRASVGCSMGIAEITSGVSISETMRCSDLAMYEAKSERSGIALFDDRMVGELNRSTELTARLKEALEDKRNISTKYQPIFARDMELVALEALFRWWDPKLGEVSAEEAIQTARKSRLLNQISLFVAESACAQLGHLGNQRACLNLESVQLLDTNFMGDLSALIFNSSIEPARVQLEFSEKDLVEYWSKVKSILRDLADQGFLLAVDNFGSSNASLTHLAELGVSEVKFDPTVLQFAQESENISVIRAKTSLAHSLGMTVTCKGVSTVEEEAIARQSGCDFMQGYRLGLPQPIGVFTEQRPLVKDAVA